MKATKTETKPKKSQRPTQISKPLKKAKEKPTKLLESQVVEENDFIVPEQGRWITESLLKLLSKWNIIAVGLALGYFAVFHIVLRVINSSLEYTRSLHAVLGEVLPPQSQAELLDALGNFSFRMLSGIYLPAALGLCIFLILFIGSQWVNYKKKKLNILSFIVMLAIFLRLACALLPYTEGFLGV